MAAAAAWRAAGALGGGAAAIAGHERAHLQSVHGFLRQRSRSGEGRLHTISAEAKPSDSARGQLSTGEYFDSVLRRKKANESALSGSSSLEADELDVSEEARQRVRDKLQQQLADLGGEQQASGDAGEKPIAKFFEDRAKSREERRQIGLTEYAALKRELVLTTGGVVAVGTAYCFFLLSLQAAVSYALGGAASCGYLLLLFSEVDKMSVDNVPQVFRKTRRSQRVVTPYKKGGSGNNLQKALVGSVRVLSSPRLAVPAGLFLLWAVSDHLTTGDPDRSFHLELAPTLLGFFAYKAATLFQAYRDNKDLISRL